jgi:hypothetical protein
MDVAETYCFRMFVRILLKFCDIVSLWCDHTFYNIEAPPNSWIDSIGSPKVKTTEGKWVGACPLVRNISKVEGHDGALGWGLVWVTSESIIHTNLHKPNNKLVSA